ncbi:hypothetical protein LX36DRAFT_658097 [Colletotrichum falcatum]|nr:hypothetical protein LX36DRAFT_658097 [Colletotrichum falcatum]
MGVSSSLVHFFPVSLPRHGSAGLRWLYLEPSLAEGAECGYTRYLPDAYLPNYDPSLGQPLCVAFGLLGIAIWDELKLS